MIRFKLIDGRSQQEAIKILIDPQIQKQKHSKKGGKADLPECLHSNIATE